MREGWWKDDQYLILFGPHEIAEAGARYGLNQFLSGFDVLALKGWDDMVVRSSEGTLYTVPTVPLVDTYLERYDDFDADAILIEDPRFTGKIKWHIKPVALGGDPSVGENLIWVSHKAHGQAVIFWNKLIRDVESPVLQPNWCSSGP